MDNTDDPYEVGLGFAVKLDKPGGFIGRDALKERKKAGPPTRRLVQVLLEDPEPLMFHGEIVHRSGTPVGDVRAASYGFTLGGAVGLAMIEAEEPVNAAYLERGTWEVDVAGTLYPAEVSLRPMYDPKSERVKG
jgi:4-methylaminobutanoate oxidase (formaldehyde-forming)